MGVNHNGDVRFAHRLIDVASESGADVVKFQTFDPAAVVSGSGKTADYQRRSTGALDQLSMLRSLTLPLGAWKELADHSTERGIRFLSTAFDWPSLEHLLSLGMTLIKVPSGEIDNLRFIRRAAELGLPLIISTGMANWAEVDLAVENAASAPDITLLHCVSSYPAPPESTNLAVIPVMNKRYGCPIGWSDHTRGDRSAVIAVALGATTVEKHITLDRSLSGPDHAASADPEEFGAYVAAIRQTELMLGTTEKRRTVHEEEIAMVAKRSHHAAHDLAAGMVLEESDTVLLRPALGAPASWDLTGRRLMVAVGQGVAVESRFLEPTTRGE